MKTNENDILTVKKVLDGDTEAFSTLVDRYGDTVFALVNRIVGQREEAEEVTQDVFLKVYSSLKRYRGDSTFSTWLYRVAYNTAVSHVRRRRHRYVSIDEGNFKPVADDDMEDTFSRAAEDKRYDDLEEALSKLLPEERALITLFYNEERSIDDISEITGNSPSNVKVKLHRIRKKLYILIEEKNGKRDK